MLSMKDFENGIERLKNAFGKRNYSTEKIKLIWDEVHSLANETYDEIIGDLIADSRFAPTRKDFRECLSSKRLAHHNQNKRPVVEFKPMERGRFLDWLSVISKTIDKKYTDEQLKEFFSADIPSVFSCNTCQDRGFFFMVEEGKGYRDYVFKCKCSIGKQIVENFPEYSSQLHLNYCRKN